MNENLLYSLNEKDPTNISLYDKIKSIKAKRGIKDYTEEEIEQIIHESRNL